MPVYDGTQLYITGEPIRGATVTVLVADTNTAASLFDPVDEVTPIGNPVTTTTTGRLHFAAAAGIYDLRVETAYGTQTVEDVVLEGGGGTVTAEGLAISPPLLNADYDIFTNVEFDIYTNEV